ncbi:hypothetical protein V496_04653 [Pseudogymnoascus sp. VKM F-4515 (FW-2607)]|nr:hypothetical protein V496_04653 [Pseudogymnoascus sp. VKM F-4515 (FW-2607)]
MLSRRFQSKLGRSVAGVPSIGLHGLDNVKVVDETSYPGYELSPAPSDTVNVQSGFGGDNCQYRQGCGILSSHNLHSVMMDYFIALLNYWESLRSHGDSVPDTERIIVAES